MSVRTLTVPSADEQQKLAYNRRVKAAGTLVLPLGQKLASVVLQLSPAVTQADYPALKTAIEAIAGIQKVTLLVDGITPDSIPENTELVLVGEVHLRIEDIEA